MFGASNTAQQEQAPGPRAEQPRPAARAATAPAAATDAAVSDGRSAGRAMTEVIAGRSSGRVQPPHQPLTSSPAQAGDLVSQSVDGDTQRVPFASPCYSANALGYWVARSSRAMTGRVSGEAHVHRTSIGFNYQTATSSNQPGLTATPSRSRGAMRPSFAWSVPPSSRRGRAERRVPDAPAASCAKVKSTRVRNHGHTGNIRRSARSGFCRLAPRTGPSISGLPEIIFDCASRLKPTCGGRSMRRTTGRED